MTYHLFSSSRRNATRMLQLAAISAVMALALSACGGTTAKPSEVSQTLRFGISAEPGTLITGVSQGAAGSTIRTFIHRGLMAYDSNGELINGLAESVKMPDQRTYTFTLRPNLTFSDGSPLTANTVKASLEYYAKPKTASTLYAGFRNIESVTVEDESNVTVKLLTPDSGFLQWLAVPIAAIVPENALNSTTDNTIGAGPFYMKSYEKGLGMVLNRFDGYYGARDVALESIDITFYTDANARTNALLSGDVDLIDYVPWENFDSVSKSPGITLDAQAGPFQFVQFNVTKGPFANPLVRQAVAYAINRDNAVSAGFQGNGKPLYGIVMDKANAALAPEGQELWSYNVDKAKSLLTEAGYPNGFAVTMLTTSEYKFLQDTALSVQADLTAIGLTVTLDAPDWATRVAKGEAGDYDIAISGDCGAITDLSYLMGWVSGPNNYNRSFNYDNDKLAAKFKQGLQATTDAGKKAAYSEALKIWKDDVPFASIDTREQAFAFNSKVSGFKNLPGFLTFYGGYSMINVSMTK